METLTTRCPHCEGPLVLQRAAPGAEQRFRIVCVDCGATSRSSDAGGAIEELALTRPAGLDPITRPGKQ